MRRLLERTGESREEEEGGENKKKGTVKAHGEAGGEDLQHIPTMRGLMLRQDHGTEDTG